MLLVFAMLIPLNASIQNSSITMSLLKSHAQLQKPAHITKHTCDLKQNGTQANPQFFGIVSCALNWCSAVRFVWSVRSRKQLLIGQICSNSQLEASMVLKQNQPYHKKGIKTALESGAFCVAFLGHLGHLKNVHYIPAFQHLA